jgi:rare lipoprotein A
MLKMSLITLSEITRTVTCRSIRTSAFLLMLLVVGCGSPVVKTLATEEGLASFYSTEFHGRRTSNGESFDKDGMTAAHRSFPFNTVLRVTNLKNGMKVDVRVNDRGPVKPERIIDLTFAAAKEIDMVRDGLARVRVEVLEWGN